MQTDQTNPSPKPVHRRRPLATTTVLAVTTVITLLQFVFPEVLELLRRRPGALTAGEWWRIISPLFVHAEGSIISPRFVHAEGWPHLLFNVAWIAYVGVVVERLFGSWRWLVIYFVSGVIGELAGFAWKPNGAGASLGGSGILGALCVWIILTRPAHRWQYRFWALLGLVGAAVLCAISDLHGPPILAGALIAAVMLWQDALTVASHPAIRARAQRQDRCQRS
jgi:rhomboid protease GluP